MHITWVCRNCKEHLASVEARDDDPRVAALTAQAEDGIIDYDQTGSMIVRILCEDCLEMLNVEEESDIIFLRSPEIH